MDVITFRHKESSKVGVTAINIAYIESAYYRQKGQGLTSSNLKIKMATSGVEYDLWGSEAERVWAIMTKPSKTWTMA